MPKQNVLQIVQHLRPGGIETMALDLMNSSSKDREVHILSLEGSASEAISAWPRLRPVAHRIHFLDKKPGLDVGSILKLVNKIKSLNISIIHTHHIGPLIYGGVAGRIAMVKKIIHTEHDAWHLNNSRRRRVQAIMANIIRPIFVADADLVAKALKESIPSIDPHIIHNGIDTDKFSPGDRSAARTQFGLPHDVQIIGCAARLEAVKGHIYLIEALGLLPNSVHLALAGEGSLRSTLEEQVKTEGLQKRVHFLGNIDDMPAFHRAQDVFCLASEKEGLPLSPLEAQSTGVPVVLTDVGGCREAICSKTGHLVPAKNPIKMADRLRDLLLNRGIEQNPRDFVCQQRNLTQTVRAYEALH